MSVMASLVWSCNLQCLQPGQISGTTPPNCLWNFAVWISAFSPSIIAGAAHSVCFGASLKVVQCIWSLVTHLLLSPFLLPDGHKNKENICGWLVGQHGSGRCEAVFWTVREGKAPFLYLPCEKLHFIPLPVQKMMVLLKVVKLLRPSFLKRF